MPIVVSESLRKALPPYWRGDLERLRTDLVEQAYVYDRRGEPGAAEAMLEAAARILELGETWAVDAPPATLTAPIEPAG